MKPEFIEPVSDRFTRESEWEDPPVLYRHWRRGLEPIHEPGDWGFPYTPPEAYESRDWQYVGWAPKPRGRRQAFLYHYRHGRLMRYPFLSVLVFALKNKEIGK